MTGIKIEVRGSKEIVRQFQSATEIVKGELMDAMTKAAVVVHKRLRDYPPARPSSTYVRTGQLGRGWEMDVRPLVDEVQAFITNAIPYAPYVQSATEQAGVHRGRWPTGRKILEEQRQKVIGFFQAAIRNIARYLER